MAGLLSDVLPAVYSASNVMKNKLRGLLDDPLGTLQQAVGDANDRARSFNALGDRSAAEQIASLKAGQGLSNGPASNALLGLLSQSYSPVAMTAWSSSPGTWAGMTREAYEAKQLANAQSGERMRSAWDDRMKEDLSQVLAQKGIYQPPPTQRDQDMKFLFSSYSGFINPKAARQMLDKNQLNASAKEIDLLRKYYDNNGNLIPRSEP